MNYNPQFPSTKADRDASPGLTQQSPELLIYMTTENFKNKQKDLTGKQLQLLLQMIIGLPWLSSVFFFL